MMNLVIVNRGDHPRRPDWGRYRYDVLVNNASVQHGVVEDHDRRLGWPHLVGQIADRWRAPALPEDVRRALKDFSDLYSLALIGQTPDRDATLAMGLRNRALLLRLQEQDARPRG